MAEVAADGASDSGLNKTLFDSLPDEMVVLTLSYVDPDTLVDCRLVCRRWQLLVENYAFQEKASRENEWVNDGRGFYSFSAIDRNTVRKLDLPWYVFRAICKHDPFHRNLIKNHCGQNQFEDWDIDSEENWWGIEQKPKGCPELPDNPDFEGQTSCFVSTYRLCVKSQTVFFKNYGLNETVMKVLKPRISFSEWYAGRFDCGCSYSLKATIFDKDDNLLIQHNINDTLPQWEGNIWTKASFTFRYQLNQSYLTLEHSGIDSLYWAGYYGTKISGSVVKMLLPIKLKCA